MAASPAASSQHPASSMERLLIWCEGRPIGGIDPVSYAEVALGPGPCMHFRSAPHFTRWLFQQERGPQVVPHVILVCGPRELKPCAQALVAARTGDETGLRGDSKRTAPHPEAHVHNIVVGAIICISEDERQLNKLQNWLKRQGQVLPLSGVCRGIEQLPSLDDSLARMFRQECSADHRDGAAQYPDRSDRRRTKDARAACTSGTSEAEQSPSNTAPMSASSSTTQECVQQTSPQLFFAAGSSSSTMQQCVQTSPQEFPAATRGRGSMDEDWSRCRTPSPEDNYISLTGNSRPQFHVDGKFLPWPGPSPR